jgi:spore germination cell wall hydrolase CwlJ-like protein
LAGQLAVGQVIANRANSGGRFPSSYCGVLFQRSQFSFVRGRSLPSVPRASKQWQTAVAMAKIVDKGLKASVIGNALFFHARYVSPGWRLKRVASIGNHIFYR